MDFPELYYRHRAVIQVRERLIGGIPLTGDVTIITAWLKSKGLDLAAIEEIAEETAAEMAEQETEEPTSGFKKTVDGFVCLEARCVNAMLREVATSAAYTGFFRGPSRPSLKQGLQHAVSIKPQRISLGVKDPSSTEVKPIHTFRGSAIKRANFVDQPRLVFESWIIKTNRLVTMKWGGKTPAEKFLDNRRKGFTVWDQILFNLIIYGQELGLGAWRTQYEGKFDLVSFDRWDREEDDWARLFVDPALVDPSDSPH